LGAYRWMPCGALAFAAMSTCAHALAGHCDWQLIAAARAGLALLFAALLAWAGRVRLVFWRPRTLWMRSIAGSISLTCGFYALTRMPVADVLTVTNMFPIWVALLSWPLLGIVPGVEVWIATVMGLAGVVLIQQPHLAAGNPAMIYAVISSFTSAISLLGLHQLRGTDVRAIVVHFSAVSLVFCLAAWRIFPRDASPHAEMTVAAWSMLLGMGLAATTGQICLTKAFALGDPAKVSIVGLTQVGFGMLFDALVWGRSFKPLTLAGIALIVAPTAWLLLRRGSEPAEVL
jgi:drug/metabolite transporter (DMT)-like permease